MIGPSSDVAGIVAHLETLRSEENISGMARFGIVTDRAIGISNPDLQKIARTIKRGHGRALDLWRTGIREARMLAIYTADPAALTPAEARGWSEDFASWEIVDTAADLFTETAFWQDLIADFAQNEREFVRRTAFAMIAGAAVHRKLEPDATFLAYLPLIEAHSTDPRNFVKKRSTGRSAISASATAPATPRPWHSPKSSPPRPTRPPAGSARTPSRNCRARSFWRG